MTDRVKAFTVILEKEMRIDDAESLITAIKTMRGVLKVETQICNMDDYIAQSQAAHELRMKLWDVLMPKLGK